MLKVKLDNFLLDKDAHAFLLNGPWGVGKTFSVDEWSKSIGQKYKVINLSLFGVSSVEELNALALNAECFKNKIVKYLKSLNQDVGVAVGPVSVSIPLIGIVSNALKEEHDTKHKYLFIIDDIERKDCRLEIPDIYGFIDSLPKDNTKVIIIANSKKLLDGSNEFNGFKDKVIQYEYYMEKPTNEAINAILGENYSADFFGEKIRITNLRTLIRIKKIFEKIKGGLDDIKMKCIALCSMSIWENAFSKDDYINNYKHYEEGVIMLIDSNIKETAQKDLDKKIKSIQSKSLQPYDYLYENIRLLNLLNAVKEEKLKDAIAFIYKCIQNDDYEPLKEYKIPLRGNSLKRTEERGSFIFLNENPNKEYKRILEFFDEAFSSNDYDKLDLFRKMCQVIISNVNIVNHNSKLQQLEKKVIANSIKPTANYILNNINSEDEDVSLDKEMFFNTLPNWYKEAREDLFNECCKLFNSNYFGKAKEDKLDPKEMIERIKVLRFVFGSIQKEDYQLIKIDEIFYKEIKNMSVKYSGTISEEEWHYFHFIGSFINKNISLYSFDKSISLIKDLSKKKGIIGKRFSILVRTYFYSK